MRLFLLLCLITTLQLTAQNDLDGLSIHYKVVGASASDKDTSAGLVSTMLGSMDMTIASTDSHHLTHMKGPDDISWMAFIHSYHHPVTRIYGLVEGEKVHGESTGKGIKDSLMYLVDGVIKHYPLDTKNILGYITHKVEYRVNMDYPADADSNAHFLQTVTAYITTQVHHERELFLNTEELQYLQHIPLEFRIKGAMTDITYEATSLKKSVPGDIKYLNDGVFKAMTVEEVEELFTNE